MRLKTAIRKNIIENLPHQFGFPIERFYDYHFAGNYVRNDVDIIKLLCQRDAVSLDIGANRGQMTLFLLRYSSCVHCFEPVPELADHLARRFRNCGISIHGCALGNVDGEMTLNIPLVGSRRMDTRSSLAKSFLEEQILGESVSNVENISVPVRRLDDLGFENIGFIKIDVEGFEAEVLEGARETILSYKPNMLIEIEQRHCEKRNISDIFDSILSLGYHGYFVYGGSLRNIRDFDLQKMQNPLHERSGDYVNNFAFSRTPLL